MTVKLVALFAPADDPEAFERHFAQVHAPLVAQLPGLQRWESARTQAAPDGERPPFDRVSELYFADLSAYEEAMRSAAGRATGRDFRGFAPPGSRLLIALPDFPS